MASNPASRKAAQRSPQAWKALKPATRQRYQKAGITRSDYLRGASLAAARGHSQTPERPERAANNPRRYSRYTRRGGKTMSVVSTSGVQDVRHLSKAERSVVGKYWNAVTDYLDGRDENGDGLAAFEGRTVNGVELETGRDALDWWATHGDLSFESLYPDAATMPTAT